MTDVKTGVKQKYLHQYQKSYSVQCVVQPRTACASGGLPATGGELRRGRRPAQPARAGKRSVGRESPLKLFLQLVIAATQINV